MQVLPTHVDTTSDDYRSNRDGMLGLLAELDELLAAGRAGGSERAVARHRERGRLLPRERIELLVDPDTPLLELSSLTAAGTEYHVGGGGVAALGVVSGVECLIGANDPTVKGGATNPFGLRRALRTMEIARANRLPLINLTESAGADLPKQAEIFVPGGQTFRNLTQLSAMGIPTITLVFGPSTAGGAYVPGMSDYAVLVRRQARVYLGGPPLVKMATGEDADEELLGGAEMHASISGVADYLADDELDALRIGRDIVAHLNWRKLGPGPTLGRSGVVDEPVHDPEELLGIGSVDVRVPFDVHEVIARVVDGSRFEAFKPRYGPTLVCGWASVHGFPVGILGNNGVLFSPEAQKGSQFIQLCNQRDIPLVFLQNITGFMVGTAYEQGGIIKDGAKLINAVANSTVPHITIMIGASYGAGNYGMAGRAYDPRFLFTWPNHRIAVMGPVQLAGVMRIVAEQAAAKAGRGFDAEAAQQLQDAFAAEISTQSTAVYATARLWDDGIIDPRDTRTVLGIALSACHSNEVKGARGYGVFRH